MQNSPKLIKNAIVRRKFIAWRNTLQSQKGKGHGNHRIDRGADKAISEVLEEQLKTHRRRWGDEGTGYIESDEKKLHNKRHDEDS